MDEDLQNFSREELLALAESEGIDFRKNWGKERILTSILTARQEATERRAALIQRATRLGIHVPSDWDNDRLETVLDSIQDAGDAAPLPVDQPASPRG